MRRPAAVWLAAAACVFAAASDAWWSDGSAADAAFVAAVALSLGAGFMFVTRRVLFSAVAAGSLLAILRAVSAVKREIADLPLHAYDLVSFAVSPRIAAGVWLDHRFYTLMLGAGCAGALALAAAAWRFDATRVRRLHALAALSIFAAAVWGAAVAKGERRHDEIFADGSSLAYFFSSWAETLAAVSRGSVIEAAAGPRGEPFETPAPCAPAAKPPHIILIHEESVVQPSQFPALGYDKALDPFFHSHDGKLHRMRVETYGGASWLTEFSVLTGVSAAAAGSLRNVVQSAMAGKVRETLPQVLARCGYRNVAIYPMLRIFLSVGRFFSAAGIHDIRDANDQRAEWPNERDRFYFANVVAELDRHVASSAKPLFVYIETMATHGSYDYAYMPEVVVAGGGPGTPPMMSEYLRRLAMAQMDYNAMLAELDRRFPGERFLIVHYGDHHPAPTLPLLGFDPGKVTFEDVMRSGNDAAFITYFAVNGIRHAPPALPPVDVMDVPYLGTVILEAAGLPLPEVYRERRRLMALCEGRYQTCAARSEILKLHRRMIDSGLMDAF